MLGQPQHQPQLRVLRAGGPPGAGHRVGGRLHLRPGAPRLRGPHAGAVRLRGPRGGAGVRPPWRPGPRLGGVPATADDGRRPRRPVRAAQGVARRVHSGHPGACGVAGDGLGQRYQRRDGPGASPRPRSACRHHRRPAAVPAGGAGGSEGERRHLRDPLRSRPRERHLGRHPCEDAAGVGPAGHGELHRLGEPRRDWRP